MGRKRAAFKGSWYPATADECESSIDTYLKEGNGILDGDFPGCIVPHAGWYFSGSIACRTIGSICKKQRPDCLVVFGMHMHRTDTPVLLSSGEWETPFGDLVVHEKLAGTVYDNLTASRITIRETAAQEFPDENTIELQLPFIKYFFGDTPFIPIAVPPSQMAVDVAACVFEAAQSLGLSLAVIGSTDLTHYGQTFGFTPAGNSGEKAYEWVRDENDANAVNAIVSMNPETIIENGVQSHNMCCAGAAAAAAVVSEKLGANKGVTLEYASSYNKSPGSSFVGYTGILFSL